MPPPARCGSSGVPAFDVARPVGAEERLAIRTWVEDFRRVRSHRRYAVHGADGGLRLEALTDWVYVDAATGRPRRVPAELEARFAAAPGQTRERDGWDGPPPPAAPGAEHASLCARARSDTVGHVNNAAYLDVMSQAVLDALEQAGWPLERMVRGRLASRSSAAPTSSTATARATGTSSRSRPGSRPARARARRAPGGHARRHRSRLVQATTSWHWAEPGAGARLDVPDAVLADPAAGARGLTMSTGRPLAGRVGVVTGRVVRDRRGAGARARGGGMSVTLAARRADRLADVVATIRSAGGEADAVPTDMRDESQIDALWTASPCDVDGSTRS
jgi:acyl-CoA thioesterase FadM